MNLKLKLILNVKHIRIQHGLSQSEMANSIHVSLRTYQRFEAGISELKLADLENISKHFKIEVAELFQFTPESSVNVKILNKDQIKEYKNHSNLFNLAKEFDQFNGPIKDLFEFSKVNNIFQKRDCKKYISDFFHVMLNPAMDAFVEKEKTNSKLLTVEFRKEKSLTPPHLNHLTENIDHIEYFSNQSIYIFNQTDYLVTTIAKIHKQIDNSYFISGVIEDLQEMTTFD